MPSEVLLIGMWPNEWSPIFRGQHRVGFFVSALLRIVLEKKSSTRAEIQKPLDA
jgi:hypothetical protein